MAKNYKDVVYPVEKKIRKEFTLADKQRIRLMYESGEPVTKIAAEIGCDYGVMYSAIEHWGLKIRGIDLDSPIEININLKDLDEIPNKIHVLMQSLALSEMNIWTYRTLLQEINYQLSVAIKMNDFSQMNAEKFLMRDMPTFTRGLIEMCNARIEWMKQLPDMTKQQSLEEKITEMAKKRIIPAIKDFQRADLPEEGVIYNEKTGPTDLEIDAMKKARKLDEAMDDIEEVLNDEGRLRII